MAEHHPRDGRVERLEHQESDVVLEHVHDGRDAEAEPFVVYHGVRELPLCRGCRLTFETNGLKALYCQGDETERFQHAGST